MRSSLQQCRRTFYLPQPHSCATITASSTTSLFSSSSASNSRRQQNTWAGYTPDALDPPLHSLPRARATPPLSNAAKSSSEGADDSSSNDTLSTAREENLARARVVFGSRLAGPAQRPPPHLDPRSTLIAGVFVPPKPDEPDNCCMSGCAHCVWDLWREDMEDWAAKSKEAEGRLAAAREGGGGGSIGGMQNQQQKREELATGSSGGALKTGDSGAGTVAGGEEASEELFRDVPVGIREFMRTEKKLRERKAAATATAG